MSNNGKSEGSKHLRIGTYVRPRLQIGEALGKGAFGTVYKGFNFETGETVAIKRIGLDGIPSSDLVNFEHELEILKKLNHPNIVHYVGVVRSDHHLNIMLEFIENGSLLTILDRFGTFPESLTAIYIAQVLEGLSYLHDQNVIHLDVKAANVLTTKDGQVKLADFGVSTISQKSLNSFNLSQHIMGSPYWMAPEVIQMEGVCFSSDIWSLGCTIIELIAGEPPYYKMPQMSAMYHIVECKTPPLFPSSISEELSDFLTKCFQRDPEKRSRANELLEHSWITKCPQKKPNNIIKSLGRLACSNQNINAHEQPIPSSSKIDFPSLESKSILRSNSSHVLSIASNLEDLTQLEETVEEIRHQVVIEFRNNQMIEGNIKRLDKKIELLIRNRISIEEVINSPRVFGYWSNLSSKVSTDYDINSWKSPALLEGYGALFYLLQTQPQYLASFIFFHCDSSEKFVERLILNLFGFAFSPREEYLLLQFFNTAIQREISNLSSINAFSDEANILLRMIIAYTHRVQEQDFLKQVLEDCINMVLSRADINFEYECKSVYDNYPVGQDGNNPTGEESSKYQKHLESYESLDNIEINPEIDKISAQRVEQLLEITDIFFTKIISSIDQFPYGLRQIIYQLKLALESKFIGQEERIQAILGYVIYYRFMNPALVTPEDYEMATTLTQTQRVNLIYISKILSYITNEKRILFISFLEKISRNIEQPQSYLNIDHLYLEYTATHHPVIYISPNEMFLTHRFLMDKLDKIAPNANDNLRKIIESMPEPPPIITGEPRLDSEMPLTLHPLLDLEVKSMLHAAKTDKLYTNTKKMITDMITDSYKDSLYSLDLLQLLTGPGTSISVKMSLTVSKLLKNLGKLEKKGLVSKEDHYRSILDDIQQDLNQKASLFSQLELERPKLLLILHRLKMKRIYLQEQLDVYNDYVKICLERSVSLRKVKNSSQQKKDIGGKGHTVRYSCSQLLKRGIIFEIAVPPIERSILSFEISEAERVGLFTVSVYAAVMKMQTIHIELDDLLEKRYNNIDLIEFMDGRVKIRIDLLILLLNKMTIKGK